MSYEHLILINDDSSINIESLSKELSLINWRENQVKIDHNDSSIEILINNWHFEIGLNKDEFVIVESMELAEEFARNHPKFNQIKSCRFRLELVGDPDFDMENFNNFCLILERIESFSHVFTFNPHEGFLNI